MTPGGGPLLSVGMTGGIACGRSTIGRIFSDLGAFVVDMDEVAHGLLAPGGAAAGAVGGAFGPAYLDASGGVLRRELGRLVFADAAARRRLEEILHPLIQRESERRIADWSARQGGGIAISDAALLVETGGWRRYQRLIVVHCRPEVQLARLMRRDGLSEADARARIAAQAPLPEKTRVADYLIETSGTLAGTEAKAREVFGLLQEDLKSLPALPARRPH